MSTWTMSNARVFAASHAAQSSNANARRHGNIEDESHFHVLIVAPAFEGQALLDRHRAVQTLFTDDAGRLKFHALRITAKTPAQWAKTQSIPAAPQCSGGDGRKPTDSSQF